MNIIIGFIGDIHGRVFHTMAVITEWQRRTNQKFDLLIQVGDLGAYPWPDDDLRKEKYVRQDEAQLDFSRLLKAEGKLADQVRYLRENHIGPIYFIRGNHEDFDWLDMRSRHAERGVVGVDPFHLYHYVTDGTVLKFGQKTIAFLGGIQTKEPDRRSIATGAYEQLGSRLPGEIDILVTHDAPYGVGTNYFGETQGSKLISDLINRLKPGYLMAGHYHHRIGPRVYGGTTYMGLNVLVNLREDGERRTIQPGSMAVLDSAAGNSYFVMDDWLALFDKDFDFSRYVENLCKSEL